MTYRPNFSIMLSETTLAQLLPSIINEHTFPWSIQQEGKMFSRCSSLLLSDSLRLFKELTSRLHLLLLPPLLRHPLILTSSFDSCFSSMSSSWMASHSIRVITLPLGHEVAIWPSPWLLNIVCYSWDWDWIDLGDLGPLWSGGGLSLGHRSRSIFGLTFLKCWVQNGGFGNSRLEGLDFHCFSTLHANIQTSSHVINYCNSTM